MLTPTGELWAETSVEREARDLCLPGYSLWRLWQRKDEEWREVTDSVR